MEEVKKVSWNASQGLIMELSNRRSYANTFFINGNIRKAFNTLISIKQSVIQSISLTNRTKLKALEENFNNFSRYLYPSLSSSFNNSNREAYGIAQGRAVKIYSDYNDTLMDLLQEAGYLIGEMSDASKMKF